MQISALEVWHVNNEENNSQMCSLESGSADENIEIMKAYMCKQRGMHLGSKISREEITKKVNQSKYEKYCYITKDRKSTRLNSSHKTESRMPSSA